MSSLDILHPRITGRRRPSFRTGLTAPRRWRSRIDAILRTRRELARYEPRPLDLDWSAEPAWTPWTTIETLETEPFARELPVPRQARALPTTIYPLS